MPQGNGSPPAWREPSAFPAQGESQLHATVSGAWWQRGSGAVLGTIQRRRAVGMRCALKEMAEGDGGIEGTERKRRNGHEEGNLKLTVRCCVCKSGKKPSVLVSLHLG